MFYLLGVGLTILGAAFFSAWETGLYSANRLRLQQRHGDVAATQVLRLLNDLPSCLTTLLVGHNLASGLGAQLFTAYLILNVANGHHEVLATLVLTPLFFFFGETLPKQFVYLHANNFLCRSVKLFHSIKIILLPLTFLLTLLNRRFEKFLRARGWASYQPRGRQILRANLETQRLDGQLSDEQVAMTTRIMEIEEQQVGDVMAKLSEILTVDENLTAWAAGRLLMAHDAARGLLVNRHGKFSGMMLSVNDILRRPENAAQAARVYARAVPIFQQTTPLISALNRLRREGAALGLVRQADGEFIGAVSLNRLIGSVVSGVDTHGWNR